MPHLPVGFVYITDIAPTILTSIRYTSAQNFVGEPITGYEASKAILTQEAAQALSKVEQALWSAGYSLVIYDAYRPQQAVDHFVRWGDNTQNDKTKDIYYPRLTKQEIFAQQYISRRSSHSRGSTVDLTLIKRNATLNAIHDIEIEKRTLNDGLLVSYLQDGTLDMGTSFDLFDQASYPQSALIAKDALNNRLFLQTHMEEYGFQVHPSEWWHFTLQNEPYPDDYFNFPVR